MPKRMKIISKQAARAMSHARVSNSSKAIDDRYDTGYKTGGEAHQIRIPKTIKRRK